jgi:hypothetical protein
MSLDPVVLHFEVAGQAQVARAFTTIEQQMRRLEKEATEGSRQSARSRVKGADDEAKDRGRAASRLTKDLERQEKQATRDAEREQQRRQRIQIRSSEMAGREARRAADADIAEQKRTTRELEREEERKTNIRRRSSEMAGRLAAREANEEIQARDRASRTWGQRGRSVGSSVVGSVGRLIGGVGAVAGATLGIGGGFMLADAGRKELEAEKVAALLVNTVTTGKAPPEGASVNAILGQASQVSRELGVDKSELLQGTLEYSRKARGGDFKGSMANMGFFAKMSQVTGADITEIASAAGTLQSQNQDLKAPEMQQLLLDVYAQGKAGSMSMVDVAKQMGTLASTRSSFQGNVATNQRKLLALGQLAAPEGSVEEAGTYVKDLTQALAKPKHLDVLKRWGVKLDKYGAVESPENLIESVFRGSGGDVNKISAVFGARGVPVFRALEGAYKSAGGGEAGIGAVRAEMAKVTGATMSPEDLEAQHKQMMDTPAQKMAVAWNKIEDILESKLGPAMERFADGPLPNLADKVEGLINAVAGAASWMTQDWPHTFMGVGAIVSAVIAKDLAEAATGSMVKATLASAIKTVFGSLPVPTPVPVPGAWAGAGASGAGAAASGAGAAATEMGTAGTLGGAGLIVAGALAPAAIAAHSTQAQVDAMSTKLTGDTPTSASTFNAGTGNAYDAQTGAAITAWKAIFTAIETGLNSLSVKAGDVASVNPKDPKYSVPIAQRPVE